MHEHEGQLFLSKIPVVKSKGSDGGGRWPFGTFHTDGPLMDAKRGLKYDMKQNIGKVSYLFMLLITERKIVIAVDKTGRHHFDQVTKVNLTSHETH